MTRSTRGTRGSRWTRKELLAVLYFYIRRQEELATPQNHPLTEKLAVAMGRTNASISMRIANYRFRRSCVSRARLGRWWSVYRDLA